MKIPPREKCFELMDKYGMYDNIKEHCKMVEGVAVFLARELNKNRGKCKSTSRLHSPHFVRDYGADVVVDEELVSRAALLHDVGKVEEIEGGDKHDRVGERILKKEGYEELGIFCSKHFLGREKDLKTWEEKIISYVDKRVLHDKIVDMKARFEDGAVRYPDSYRDGVEEDIARSYEIEKDIFVKIDASPEDINLLNK